jgi:hypothetical protein
MSISKGTLQTYSSRILQATGRSLDRCARDMLMDVYLRRRGEPGIDFWGDSEASGVRSTHASSMVEDGTSSLKEE